MTRATSAVWTLARSRKQIGDCIAGYLRSGNEEFAMIDVVQCPEVGCEAPAEVIDRFPLPSTDGPIEYLRTCCLHRHLLVAPVQVWADRRGADRRNADRRADRGGVDRGGVDWRRAGRRE
jgi:hypothetical protein